MIDQGVFAHAMSDIERKLKVFRRNDIVNRTVMALAVVASIALSAGVGAYAVEWEREQQAILLSPPPNWDEQAYLKKYKDVREMVARGRFESGWHHYLANGVNESRKVPWLD